MKNRFSLALLVFCFGCATEPTVRDLNFPLAQIDKAIHKALGKIKKISHNRRDYQSDYLTTDGKPLDPLADNLQRLTVFVTIRGEQRPYDLDIEALVEEKQSNQSGYSTSFRITDKSKKIIAETTAKILINLKQNSNRNVIDDFKAF